MRTLVCIAALCAACPRGADKAAPGGKGGPGGERVTPVTAARVEKKDVSIYLDGLGTVTAYKTVTIRAQVDGRLDAVLFREGQTVKKGDLIAQLDPRPFQIQLHQAEGAKARDEAQLAAARQNLSRYNDLVARKLIAPQQADDQKGAVGQLEGTVRIDQAQIEAAHLNLSYARIVSPIDGVAGLRAVDQGNYLRASDPTGLVVLTQLDPIGVIFTLSQDELLRIAEMRSKGDLAVEIYGRDGTQKLGTGRLEVIDNAINATTATLRLKAVLANPKKSLWPNQFVKARLLLTVRKDATVVPAPALQRGPDGTFVYVIAEDKTVAPKPVVVERQQGEDALLTSGVNPGELVVVEGQNQLKPGSKVNPRMVGEKAAGPARREGAMAAP